MLKDAKGFRRVVIACGRTDLRRGIDGLADIVQEQFRMDPSEKNVLFLFCGTRLDRIKGLVFEGDGYLLLYKRLAASQIFAKNLNPDHGVLPAAPAAGHLFGRTGYLAITAIYYQTKYFFRFQ